MSPTEAKRLVGITGHSSPQPEADVWEECAREHIKKIDRQYPERMNWVPSARWLAISLAEIDRLRTALRAVRASTDPAWQLQIIKDALREDQP